MAPSGKIAVTYYSIERYKISVYCSFRVLINHRIWLQRIKTKWLSRNYLPLWRIWAHPSCRTIYFLDSEFRKFTNGGNQWLYGHTKRETKAKIIRSTVPHLELIPMASCPFFNWSLYCVICTSICGQPYKKSWNIPKG